MELKAKSEEIKRLLQQHDVSGDVNIVASEPYMVADVLARHAMLCDVALVGEGLPTPDTLFRQVVYGRSGRFIAH